MTPASPFLFPYAQRFIPVVLAPPEDVEPLAYARDLMRACRLRSDGTLSPEDLATVDAYQLLSEPPRCVDAARTIQSLSDDINRRAISEWSAIVAAGLKERLPRQAGETDVKAQLSALSDAYAGYPEGTVVYDRLTDRAHVAFLLLHIQVGLRSGLHRIVGVPDEYSPHGPPLRPSRPGSPHIAAMAALDDATGETLKTCAIGVFSTLAWALPPPWGPVAAAGMTLVGIFCGGHSGPTVGDLLKQSTEALRDYIDANAIAGDSAKLAAFSDWMTTTVRVLDKLPDQIDYKVWLPAQIQQLRDATGPNGDSFVALADLHNHLEQPGGLDMYILGVELHLLGLKLILQLEAQIASWHENRGDAAGFADATATWLNDYAVFSTAFDEGSTVPNAAANLRTAVEHLRAKRLAQISPPAYTPSHYPAILDPHTIPPLTPGYWTWGDSGDKGERNYSDDLIETKCGFGETKTVSHEDTARAEYTAHVADVTRKLDAAYAHVGETITKWSAVINEWNQHLPPTLPPHPPAIDPDGWKGSPPANVPGWVKGSTVAYAIAYVNARGPGPLSPYGTAAPVEPTAGATLVDIPPDPLKMAERVRIYRQVKPPEDNLPVRLAAIIDAGVPTWRDEAK